MRKANLQWLLFILSIWCTTAFANKLKRETPVTDFRLMDTATSFAYTSSESVDTKIYYTGFTENDSLNNEKLIRRAMLTNKLGLSALIGFFVPLINFFSLPAAITALFIGYPTKKRLKDRAAKRAASKGIIASWLAIGLVAIVTYIIIRLF